MNPITLLMIDILCWIVALLVLWLGPQWTVKVSITLLIIAQIALLMAISGTQQYINIRARDDSDCGCCG
jgi:hypothetical protein